MHIQTVRSIAKEHGIKAGRMSKMDAIRAIQRWEGNFDCFGTAVDGICDQLQCAWRDDCLAGSRKRKS
jgi:hypothetical protein